MGRSFTSVVIAAMLLSLFWVSAPALAQLDYPVRPIRVLVGFPGGTAPDIGARVLGDKLAEALGKPIVVEDVPGASGMGAKFIRSLCKSSDQICHHMRHSTKFRCRGQ